MFRSFFRNPKWFLWAYIGSVLILGVTWYKVQLDVQINEWFGSFYDIVQKALGEPGSITFAEYMTEMMTFFRIAGVYIVIAVVLDFFIKHFIFRWRTAMNDYYMSHWQAVRHIEGASQRVQEDTMRFARIMEGLGVSFMRSIMTLIAFLPLLWTLSENVTELPWIGEVSHSLVYVAILSAASGTVLLAAVGFKLPGLEFENQKVEAAYRKELVYGEDNEERAQPPSVIELFGNVRKNYFRLYFHYLYFDVARWSYLQATVLVPYIALGPTIVGGAITLGVMQQIVRAFSRVENSFQYLVNAWTTIVELISVYKRLRAFEANIWEYERNGGQPVEMPAQ
ncbi:peptide antibiotic transporter SbmA [Roseibium sp.]|uniref:peptide antibiotic transporter SbmA n=1 Tax=Roseibium sp. TaxID=1936156 RepID=UPI003A976F95